MDFKTILILLTTILWVQVLIVIWCHSRLSRKLHVAMHLPLDVNKKWLMFACHTSHYKMGNRQKGNLKLTQKKKLKTKMAYLTHNSQLLKAAIPALFQQFICCLSSGSWVVSVLIDPPWKGGGGWRRGPPIQSDLFRKRPQRTKHDIKCGINNKKGIKITGDHWNKW